MLHVTRHMFRIFLHSETSFEQCISRNIMYVILCPEFASTHRN